MNHKLAFLLASLVSAVALPSFAQQVILNSSIQSGDAVPTAVYLSSSSGIIKNFFGNFYGAYITLSPGQAGGNLEIFDSTTVPADGAVTPRACFHIESAPASSGRTTAIDATVGAIPISFANGITWAYSSATSCAVKTAQVADFVSVGAR